MFFADTQAKKDLTRQIDPEMPSNSALFDTIEFRTEVRQKIELQPSLQ